MMRKARRWYFKHSKGADLGNVLRFLIWQPDRSNRDGPQAILCDASAWWWPLTKRPSLAGEYEKADPNRGRCGIPDDSARQDRRVERGRAGRAGQTESHKHADGNEVPSPSHAGGVGLAVRRLASLLAGRMGQ